jgi:hypothetical protein
MENEPKPFKKTIFYSWNCGSKKMVERIRRGGKAETTS